MCSWLTASSSCCSDSFHMDWHWESRKAQAGSRDVKESTIPALLQIVSLPLFFHKWKFSLCCPKDLALHLPPRVGGGFGWVSSKCVSKCAFLECMFLIGISVGYQCFSGAVKYSVPMKSCSRKQDISWWHSCSHRTICLQEEMRCDALLWALHIHNWSSCVGSSMQLWLAESWCILPAQGLDSFCGQGTATGMHLQQVFHLSCFIHSQLCRKPKQPFWDQALRMLYLRNLHTALYLQE